MNFEFNMLLEDYLALEEYVFYSGTNIGYEKLKKATIPLFSLIGILLGVGCYYFLKNQAIFFIPIIIVFTIVLYKLIAEKMIWRSLKPQLRKQIIQYEFSGYTQGMNHYKVNVNKEGFYFSIKDEHLCFKKADLLEITIKTNYFILYDLRNRTIVIPIKKVDASIKEYLMMWTDTWERIYHN